MQSRTTVVVSAVAVVLLAAVSTMALGFGWSRSDRGRSFADGDGSYASTPCTVPQLPGVVVHVTLSNAGGPMFGRPMMGGLAQGGMMRLRTDVATVPHGTVSLVATNVGSVNHELVVLPLPRDQIAGTRAVLGDGRVDEQASLGEASTGCAAGAGDGIAPGDPSWVTLTLTPGRYELVCNLPGHYAAGMYAELTVR